MAELTIAQAIERLEGLPERVASIGASTMRAEFAPHTKTGKTISQLYTEIHGSTIFIGFPAGTKGAYYVQNGRRAITKTERPMMHWVDGRGETFTWHVSAAPADDFVGRTAKKIRSMHFW